MTIEGQNACSFESSSCLLSSLDETTRIMGELDRILDEMKQTLEMIKLVVGEDDTTETIAGTGSIFRGG